LLKDTDQVNKATISIIFPVGRMTRFTIESLKSCLNQSYKDLIIIVIDNSKDTEFRKHLQFISDSRILYIKNNMLDGAAEVRNFAFEHVKTRFISIVDSDDVLLPDHLKTAVNTLTENKSDFYYCGYINRFSLGVEIKRVPKKRLSVFDLLTLNPIGHSTVVMKACIKPRYPKYKKRHDVRLWLKFFDKKIKFISNPDVMVVRNITKNSLSSNKFSLLLDHIDINYNLMKLGIFKSLFYLMILILRHLYYNILVILLKFKNWMQVFKRFKFY